MNRPAAVRKALGFVVILGIVSLFADANYEGGRSIAGPYLFILGLTPVLLGFMSGAIDLFQYFGRYAAGLWVDRNGHAWFILVLGYVLNLFALPALMFTHELVGALGLLFLERLGRGIRNPVKNSLLAHAGDALGHGRAFGLYEILDQAGAVLGPLFVGFWLLRHSFRMAFATLLIPALIAMVGLGIAYRFRSRPATGKQGSVEPEKVPSSVDQERIRQFMIWVALGAAAPGTYIFIGYVLMAHNHWTPPDVAGAFALAMATDGVGGYCLGMLYDRLGFLTVYIFPAVLGLSIAFIFWGHTWLVWAGIGLWGIQLGFTEAIIPAMFGHIIPRASRARLFGILGLLSGISGLLGVGVMGVLYAIHPAWTPVWTLIMAVAAIYFISHHGWVEHKVRTG